MGYCFAPLFGVLSGDPLAAISPILRLVLSAPLIAIFIVYFVRSVKGALASAIELIKALAGVAVANVAFYTQHPQAKKQRNAQPSLM
jgi:hypothetical protein